MSNSKAVMTQAELKRYLTAMREAGITEGRVEIEKPDGTKVSIIAGKISDADVASDDLDVLIRRAKK